MHWQFMQIHLYCIIFTIHSLIVRLYICVIKLYYLITLFYFVVSWNILTLILFSTLDIRYLSISAIFFYLYWLFILAFILSNSCFYAINCFIIKFCLLLSATLISFCVCVLLDCVCVVLDCVCVVLICVCVVLICACIAFFSIFYEQFYLC